MLHDQEYDGVVVADYGKGVFDSEYGEPLREKIAVAHHMTIVNAKDTERWSRLSLKFLVCNDKEALKTWGPLTDHEIVQKCRSVYFVRTRGEHGVTMCHHYGDSHHHATLVKEVVDVTGAGDAFTAGFAHCLVTEGYWQPTHKEKALARGSQWAAHCCGQIGCGTPLGDLASERGGYDGKHARMDTSGEAGLQHAADLPQPLHGRTGL
jgi:sugar/nucleoside kinase (ribokinase family)